MSDTFWDIADNQPTGAWAAKRRLAGALRELISLCVTSDAPQAELDHASALVQSASAALRAYPRRTFGEAYRAGLPEAQKPQFADRGTLVGLCNPVAPPLRMHADGELAVADVSFGPAYEGAPGYVHGGIIAAALDQLVGYAALLVNRPCMTGRLTVHYHQPTPILTELRLEARPTRNEGKKCFLRACLRAGERTFAEAEALLIEIDVRRLEG